METDYVVSSDGAESMAYLDQERGVLSIQQYLELGNQVSPENVA